MVAVLPAFTKGTFFKAPCAQATAAGVSEMRDLKRRAITCGLRLPFKDKKSNRVKLFVHEKKH